MLSNLLANTEGNSDYFATKSRIEAELFQSEDPDYGVSIFRVQAVLFDANPRDYLPRCVYVGLLSHERAHLLSVDPRKQWLVRKYFDGQPLLLENSILAVKDAAKRCYPRLVTADGSVCALLVIDGAFVIRFLNMMKACTMRELKWGSYVSLDLLMVENQIPFHVLCALYEVYLRNHSAESVSSDMISLVVECLTPRILSLLVGEDMVGSYNGRKSDVQDPKHILDVLRELLIPVKSECPISKKTFGTVPQIRSAGQLLKSSILVKKNRRPSSLLDFKFKRKTGIFHKSCATLRIPCMRIDAGTEMLVRNIIAYEQFTDDHAYFTEYIAFLDVLIDSAADVELLQEAGVIENVIGDSQTVIVHQWATEKRYKLNFGTLRGFPVLLTVVAA